MSVASSDSCRKRVEDGNLIQQKTNHTLAMTVSDVGASFDHICANPASSNDSACIAETRAHREGPSVGNPADLDGVVNQNLCSNVDSMQTSVADGFAFNEEQLTCPVVIEFFVAVPDLQPASKRLG